MTGVIGSAPTGVALFIGATASGRLRRMQRVVDVAEFRRLHGGPAPGSFTGQAVSLFFANGASEAWFVRLPATEGGLPLADEFLAALALADRHPAFFDLLCLPDLARMGADEATRVHLAAAALCERRSAFLLVDPPQDVGDVRAALAWRARLALRSSHAGAWFPWIRVTDPQGRGATVALPPSGAIAGVIARTDREAGVWRAPAGTGATLKGSAGPALVPSDAEQGLLNPVGINGIRRFPQFGTVSFGARTLAGADADASEWKYLPVRRTADFIVRSLCEGLRWTKAKPNGEPLWAQVREAGGTFLLDLFRRRAFQGASPRDACFLKCDASTTTPADTARGVVNLVVGFAPLKPAEFVTLRITLAARA